MKVIAESVKLRASQLDNVTQPVDLVIDAFSKQTDEHGYGDLDSLGEGDTTDWDG